MFTLGYDFTDDEIEALAKASVDLIAVRVGLTASGMIGTESTIVGLKP